MDFININYLKNNILLVIFTIFVISYASLLIINPQLAPTDDFIFLRTLQAGKFLNYYSADFPYYNSLQLGRFTPLVATEYNIFGLIFKSPSPFWYFLSHAVQFILLSFLLVKLLQKFTDKKLLIYGLPTLLFFTPAIAITFFRLQLNERNVIFYFLAFLLCYLNYINSKKNIYFILSLIFATIGVYYKETGFIAIAAFSISHSIFTWNKSEIKTKILDILLAIGSFSYLIIYYFYVFSNKLSSSPTTILDKSIIFIKNIINYAFFSDPIIVLLIIPLFLFRAHKILIKKEGFNQILDPMLVAASAYGISFLFLLNYIFDMYGPYYMLPAYAFAFPPLIYYLSALKQKLFWKIAIIITAIIYIFNVFPSGIHYITYYKYLSINFNETLDFIVNDINLKYSTKKLNIFLDGVDRAGGRGTYFVFSDFLQFKGLSEKKFDLKSNIETKNPASTFLPKKMLNFTVFQKDVTDEIKSGDYLIITPQSINKNINNEYLQSLKEDYKILFQTKSPLAFPNFHFKSLAKYLLSKNILRTKKTIIQNINIIEFPDYYVLVKK